MNFFFTESTSRNNTSEKTQSLLHTPVSDNRNVTGHLATWILPLMNLSLSLAFGNICIKRRKFDLWELNANTRANSRSVDFTFNQPNNHLHSTPHLTPDLLPPTPTSLPDEDRAPRLAVSDVEKVSRFVVDQLLSVMSVDDCRNWDVSVIHSFTVLLICSFVRTTAYSAHCNSFLLKHARKVHT